MEVISDESYIAKARQSIKAIDDTCNGVSGRLEEAFDFALALHGDQRRKSGEPYIIHPVAVASIIANELKLRDPILLTAALLHDIVEDVPHVGIAHIEERFGSDVAAIVDGCTKIALDPAKGRQLAQAYTHTKIFLSASNNLGVIVIKLADRLHNMRTLHGLSPDKRMRIAKETLDIYAPIAAKLNINYLKREFYYQSLVWLYPKKSKRILHHIKMVHQNKNIVEIREQLETLLNDKGRESVIVRSRCKGLGSYYDPDRKTLDLYNAENFVDFTVVVPSEDPFYCYYVLGKINKQFPPLPRTIRDFIANPKSNGYRSLHTRFHYKNASYLVKIRTMEMDRWAVYGVLNHWHRRDKEPFAYEADILNFLKEIGEYSETPPQRKELLHSHGDEIIVYTPTGDHFYLPKSSIVLDFAYRIHSYLGDRCEGARLSGKKVSPVHVLEEGNVVEIIKASRIIDVNPEYEDLCKTPLAKKGVNRLLQKRRREYAEKIGKDIMEQELMRCHIAPKVFYDNDNMDTRYILEIFNVKSLSELFVRIGQDLTSPKSVTDYLVSFSWRSDKERNPPEGYYKITIGQLDNVVHKFAHCCNPYPGETNALAVLSERGVTIHKESCKDIIERHPIPKDRLFEIVWLLDEPWDSPLLFEILLPSLFINEFLIFCCRGKGGYRILKIEEMLYKGDRPSTRIHAVFRNIGEAKAFLENINSQYQVIVDRYRRYKDHSVG